MFRCMSRIFWGLILLLAFGVAQAQLVPEGMVLSGGVANEAAPAEVFADSVEVPFVAGEENPSMNWNEE